MALGFVWHSNHSFVCGLKESICGLEMLLSKIFNIIMSLFSWKSQLPKDHQMVDMCNKTSSLGKTTYLFHENYSRSTKFVCMCHLGSSSRLNIIIQRHFIMPFHNASSYSKLTVHSGNVSSIDMFTDINPFGSDCLFGKTANCLIRIDITEAKIQLNESDSLSRFIFKIKGDKEVNITCNRGVSKTIFRQPVPHVTTKTPETMLTVGIIFLVLGIIIAATAITLKYRNNHEFRKVPSLRISNENQLKKNANDTQLKVHEDNYEQVSTGIPATHETVEDYEFCEIVDPAVEPESTVPPQVPTTPLPNQQTNSLCVARLEKQSTIEDEEVKCDDNTYSILPSETRQSACLPNDENGEDTYDHIPNTALLLTESSLKDGSIKSPETSLTDCSNTSIPRKNTFSSQTRRLNSDGWYIDKVKSYKGRDERAKGSSLPNYKKRKSAGNIQDDIDINFAEVIAELKSFVNTGDAEKCDNKDKGDFCEVFENEMYQSLDDYKITSTVGSENKVQ